MYAYNVQIQWLCIHHGHIRTPPCAAASFGQRTHWMCVIQYISLYDCHSTILPDVILTSWARPLSLLPWGYACFVFLGKNEWSKLDDKEGTHEHVTAYVYDWVGRALTSHSGSVTGTCRYMVSLENLPLEALVHGNSKFSVKSQLTSATHMNQLRLSIVHTYVTYQDSWLCHYKYIYYVRARVHKR